MRLYHRKQEVFSRQILLMGEKVEINMLCDEEQWPQNLLESATNEMKRIEDLFTMRDVSNPIKQINAQAGIKAVKVDKEVYGFISRCMHVLELTQDAFKMIYFFKSKHHASSGDSEHSFFPKKRNPPDLFSHVEFDKQNCSVFLNEKGLHLNLRNIAKGYAKDRAKTLLKQNGVDSGYIKSASEFVTWGSGINYRAGAIKGGISALGDHEFSGITNSDPAFVTSGVYHTQPVVERHRNMHLQARKTASGCGIQSATVICNSAEMACSLHPYLLEIGLKNGLELINQMQDVAVIFTDQYNIIHTSENIRLHQARALCAV
ncbi:FAD:protein FMN transferase [Ferruginibacter paludis]|uniref:FAD:protein FMN transferase n=1 Tax=Ferruginibacter paludis TaxID=1310417 RepID=UPI0025B5A9C4|nr:FAD:protein FMN transferase [Ferruginibacter paludis]MDN3654827.1 FAD:protein FMN transferase [Ferruginibacter paludis]